MDEDAAYEWFKHARWPSTGGEPTCPKCGCIGATPRRLRRFRCRAKVCAAEFSVTSGTILASRKLSFKTLLLALALSVHSVKGKAACQLKRELGVDYKTAFVLLHKLREAIAALRVAVKLDGVVEMDGMYVGGHVRPKNEKAKRVDRRLAENRTGKRMAVMVLRERGGDNMTLAAAVPGEQGDVAWHLTKNHVARTALLRADQHPAYDELGGLNEIARNNHDAAFVVEADFSTNQAESFFSRVRRGENGIFHRLAGKYLDWYAAELAWREDKRRADFRVHAEAVLKAVLGHPVSRDTSGYWQRPKKSLAALVAWNPLRGMHILIDWLPGRCDTRCRSMLWWRPPWTFTRLFGRPTLKAMEGRATADGDGQEGQPARSGQMVPVDRALIRYTWAPETRQVGKVWVVELPLGTKPSTRDASQRPRFIPEVERTEEPVFNRGACDPTWMKGDPWQTPAGVFGDMLLTEGFASWEYTRQALIVFASIQGCDWATQMLGSFHPAIFNRDCDPSEAISTLGGDLP